MSSADWLEGVEDAHFLRSVFPSPPPLRACLLHEVSLVGDGGWVRVRFDVDQAPPSPPKKWALQGFNTAQVTLLGFGPTALSVEGWGPIPRAAVAWSRDARGWGLSVTHALGHLRCRLEALRVDRVSGYLNTEIPG